MRFLYETPAGGVVICQAAPKATLEKALGEMTDAQYRKHVLQRMLPDGVRQADVTFVADDWRAPDDRKFRDAWKHAGGGAIAVDMAAARDIHRNRLRGDRVAPLQRLDVIGLRALTLGDVTTADEIERDKQKLRDLPAHPAIEAAATPEALAALTLDALV
jgi:hypothetical protein